MTIKLLPRRHSIAANIFGAFVIMGLMTALLGGYGIYVLSAAGDIVVDTYDGALMEINFARSASLTFTQMDKEALRRKTVAEGERGEVDRKIDELSKSFFDDLAIATQRSAGAREKTIIEQIRQAVTRWNALRHDGVDDEHGVEIDKVSDQIIDYFDTLIELTADQSFIQRRKAVSAISQFRYAGIGLSAAAILVGIILTLILARRIVRPLAEAAKAADRIADGHLQTPIPVAGKDEIGMLLHSMIVMQDNIRKTMEWEVAQRQSAQSRLIDALESSREGMLLVDADGKIAIANSQVADFFPTVASDIVSGMDFAAAFASIWPLLAGRGDFDRMAPVTKGGPHIDTLFSVGEHQLLDGRWLRFSRSDTRDGGFFLFLIDFTDIKEREERFKEAKQQADEANTAKSNFLTNMSHELRTPLNAIIGFSEIISGQIFGSIGNPKYLEYVSDVLMSGRHLLTIINSMLDLAKSEAGKLELNPEALDLGGVIDDCAVMIREQCEHARLRFDVSPPAGPLPVYGEPTKLRQILLNLLSNAVKFNEPGGSVLLQAGLGKPGEIELRIVDTGIGMSPADIAVALTPFGQVDSRLARRYEGTGLGLPLTKALVELHGGTLTIDSAPGRGTGITVILPYYDADKV